MRKSVMTTFWTSEQTELLERLLIRRHAAACGHGAKRSMTSVRSKHANSARRFRPRAGNPGE